MFVKVSTELAFADDILSSVQVHGPRIAATFDLPRIEAISSDVMFTPAVPRAAANASGILLLDLTVVPTMSKTTRSMPFIEESRLRR